MNQIEKIIDIATWNRKEHFEHFSAFDDPFFGVTVHVDCTRSYQEAKDKGVSFSLLLLHRIITAASKVEEFRYRIEGDKVVCYDSLLPEATVGRADHTFSFAAFEYDPDELTFIRKANPNASAASCNTPQGSCAGIRPHCSKPTPATLRPCPPRHPCSTACG